MSLKSILVAMELREDMTAALETIVLLAKRFDSYVEGFPLQSRGEEFAAADMLGVFAVAPVNEQRAQEASRMRLVFETFMHERGLPRADATTIGLSFGWLNGEATVDTTGNYGRAFDLIAMSRPDARSTSLHYQALESALFESGHPLLLLPPTPMPTVATDVLVAWNGSTEQTRAIALALPILERAERITVLTIPGGQGVPGPSGEQMNLYLRRNGISGDDFDGRSQRPLDRRDDPCDGRCAGVRSFDQGCVHAKSPAPTDIRRSHPPYSLQRNLARAHGTLICGTQVPPI